MKKMNRTFMWLFVSLLIFGSGCNIKREMNVTYLETDQNEVVSADVVKLETKEIDMSAVLDVVYGLSEAEAEQYRLTEFGSQGMYEKDQILLFVLPGYVSVEDNRDGAGACYSLIDDGHFSFGMGLSYRLNEIWSQEELDGGTKEEAIAACRPYMEICGYEDAELTIYTMTQECLQRAGEKNGVCAPDPSLHVVTYRDLEEARKNGDSELEESLKNQMYQNARGNTVWGKEDEAYWLIYRPRVNGIVIDDVNVRLDLIYVPALKRVVFMEMNDSPCESEVIETKELISRNQAVESALMNLGAETEEKILVKEISLVYRCDFGTEEDIRKTAWPCWRIDYELTNPTQTELDTDGGTIIINAVTGEKAEFW